MKSEMDQLQDNDIERIFECFFIVKLEVDGKCSRKHTFPKQACAEKELKQCEKFCFPMNKLVPDAIGHKHQHFTFMLTDLEKNRKYGFCKLTENGKQCYCFLSTFTWFEIFYKILNCVCTIHTRKDVNTLHSIVETIYKLPVPKANDIVNVSTSLTFSVPDYSVLPSIPENRNLMEYISAINTKNMIEIFAAFMFERRVIFTSSNLSVLTGCIFAAETLLYPLSWQHIFIPVLHEHIIDYCAAPMPFIIGIHSSLFSHIKDTALTEGVVMVDIDSNIVQTPYEDLEKLPSEAHAFLRGQLGKPNIAVGTRLSDAFVKTQARIFGDYRRALKFRMGESIEFDEAKFVEMQKTGSRRSFAEELVQLQTFTEFLDRRLYMLNNGIGFHDTFETEVSGYQEEDDYSIVYKEWLSVTRKGSEFISSMRKQAKSNMKQAKESAKQSMKEMKSAIKPMPKQTRSISSLRREQSLRENITSARPPRPPPPRFSDGKKVRRFKALDEIEECNNTENNEAGKLDPFSDDMTSPSSETKLPEESELLIDFDSFCRPQLSKNIQEIKHANLLHSHMHDLSGLSITEEKSETLPVCVKCDPEEMLLGLCPHACSNDITDDTFFAHGSISNNSTPISNNMVNQDLEQPLISFD